MQVNINSYPRDYSEGLEIAEEKMRSEIVKVIKGVLGEDYDKTFEVYNFFQKMSTDRVDNDSKQLLIFNTVSGHGSGSNDVSKKEEVFKLDGIEYKEEVLCLKNKENKLIVTADGIELVEYNLTTKACVVLVNVFKKERSLEERLILLKSIMKLIKEEIFRKLEFVDSWGNEESRKMIIENIKSVVNRNKDANIRREKEKLAQLELEVIQYKEALLKKFREIPLSMKSIETLLDSNDGSEEKIAKELDLCMSIDKIKSIRVVRNEIIVKTFYLDIFASNGDVYEGNEYEFRIDMINAGFKVFGKAKGSGYWGASDPHPHVKGSNGEPCMGNVASTLVELLSQKEFYAMVQVIILWLESANLDDSAGSYVRRYVKLKAPKAVYESKEKKEEIAVEVAKEEPKKVTPKKTRKKKVVEEIIEEVVVVEEAVVASHESEIGLLNCTKCSFLTDNDEDLVTVYESVESPGIGLYKNHSDEKKVCSECAEAYYTCVTIDGERILILDELYNG